MMFCTRATAVLFVLATGLASPARADVQLTMRDGRVTLRATNATVREILAEWAKIGQARIVNAERITGGPVTLELTDVTEGQALDVILRSVAAYMAAPRAAAAPNLSAFDRILILPTSTAPRVAATPPPPAFPQPQFVPPPQQVDDDDDDPRMPVPNPNVRGPVFNTFPQPNTQPFNLQPARGANVPAGMPAPAMQAPLGVAVPGMVVQPPPQPGPIVPPQ